jgi:hypothetical protein
MVDSSSERNSVERQAERFGWAIAFGKSEGYNGGRRKAILSWTR